jgi:hypothetical protein
VLSHRTRRLWDGLRRTSEVPDQAHRHHAHGLRDAERDADLLDSVHKKFMEKYELPTHLRPTRFLSPELEHGRGIAISKGFRAPRSRSR